jgi:acetoin utilization protein AcuA
MSAYPPQELTWNTPKGDLIVRSFCSPDDILSYTFDEQFGVHAQYKSLYTKRETLAKHAAEAEANVALALADATHIVGFGVLNRPDPDERWSALGDNVITEVKAIEVSRDWRAGKVAGGILKLMLAHPRVEEMIVYMVGYSWTWDLDGTGKTALEYRNILINLFTPFGFQELPTNEPNVCLKPENLFMGRIGANISPELEKEFKWLRFGITP